MAVCDIVTEAEKHGRKLTVSGGEPTFQSKELIALLKSAKNAGIETRVDTCGVFDPVIVKDLAAYADTIAFGIKDHDPTRFKVNTKGNLATVLENLALVDSYGGKTLIRLLIIPEINLSYEYIVFAIKIFRSLKNCVGIELSRYSPIGAREAKLVDIFRYPVYKEPTDDDVVNICKILSGFGISENDLRL